MIVTIRELGRIGGAAAIGMIAHAAAAQTVLDRVDPSKVEASVPKAPPQHPNAPVAAPPPTIPSVPAASAPVTIGAIALVGLQRLHAADFADLFELYVGRTLSPPALAGLTDAIAERARSRGYVFAQATIAPQTMAAGLLRIDIDEGHIGAIRVSGADNAAVRAALAPLVGTDPVTLDAVERRLLVAGDIDGIWIRRTRFAREGATGVLTVDVGSDRIVGYIGVDNSGSRPIGPLQADATVKISQVLAAADSLTITALATPAEPREFGYLRARYARRVAADGTEVSAAVSYSHAHPGSYLTARDIAGDSWTATLGALRPLLRRRAESLWLEASLGVRNVTQDRGDTRARRDRLTIARVGAYGFVGVAGGRLHSGVTVSQGLDLFGATARGDPFASRSDASGRFTSFALSGDWTMTPIDGFSLALGIATQLATRPLLVSEETGLGGGTFLRGYNYSERIGDDGTMGSTELRYDLGHRAGLLAKPQFYVFTDGGRVTNLGDGAGGGTLFSTGGGIRSTLGTFVDADLGIAVPLSGIRYDSRNAAPIVNFRLSKRL